MPFICEGQIKNILESLGKDTYTKTQRNFCFFHTFLWVLRYKYTSSICSLAEILNYCLQVYVREKCTT